jgi:hypothetical protein
MANLKVSLLPKQHEFVHSVSPINLYVGGVGAGKTISNVVTMIKLALDYPGIEILAAAPTYAMLRDTVMDEFKKRCPSFLLQKFLEGNYPMAVFQPNKKRTSRIRFRAFDDVGKPKGITVGAAIIDEVTEMQENVLEEILRRLRQEGMPNKAWMTTNTASKEHWFYKRFVEPVEKGLLDKQDIHYIHTTSFENFKLPEIYIDQLKKLEVIRPGHYQRAVLGKWGDFDDGAIGAFLECEEFSNPYRVAFIDTSYSDKKKSDKTAVSIVSFDVKLGTNSNYWPIQFTGKTWQKSITDPTVVVELLRFLDIYKPIETCLESQLGDSTKVFINNLVNAEKQLNLSVRNHWTWFHQTKNKHERIMLEVAGAKDRLYVLKGTDMSYLSPVMAYVKGIEHEDEIDSLGSAITLWKTSKTLQEYIRLNERMQA